MNIKDPVSNALLLAAALVCSPLAQAASPGNALTLSYPQAARAWMTEALPIGNGQLGAMLFGGVERERIQFNEESLWVGNEQDTGAYQNFGDVFVQFGCEPGVSDPDNRPTPPAETVQASVDGRAETKWCIEHNGQLPIRWQMSLPASRRTPVTFYTLTSANDVPGRDPKAWRFLGSDDGDHWIVLDEQREVPPWPARNSPKTFPLQNTNAYSHYRFEFLATHNTPHFQLAEIALGPAEADSTAGVTNYCRQLDLTRAVHTVSYKKDGVVYTREAFASWPARVVVVRFMATRPVLSGTVVLKDAHGATTVAEGNRLTIRGAFPGYEYDGGKPWLPLHREAQVRVLHQSGSVVAAKDHLTFTNVEALTLFLAAGTDFLQDRTRHWRGPLPHQVVTARLEAAETADYSTLLREHIADYRRLFDRVTLDLAPVAAEDGTLPTDRRLAAYRVATPDTSLEELLFNFGRYLMIASSRAGGLPANLQGKWNDSNNPPWRSDYHTDVNIQMNYWMADPANLGECFVPYVDWLNSIRAVRMESTRKAFGTRGWTLRGESGLFGGSTWEWIPGSSAWLAQGLYDHYLFTGDRDYLKNRALPAMKEICEFWIDRLKALPDGTLVAPDGLSPEQGPREDGVSFDQQLIWDVFSNTIEACDLLGTDRAFRDLLAAKRERLLGPKIGKWGQLQEWMVDRDDPKNTHRHLSHLVALHPGRQISPLTTPKLAEAARVSLNARGDDGTGWSTAWKINMWARLLDGDRAHKIFGNLFRLVGNTGVDMGTGGGLYANLLDAHPPFQIDGNFGYVAGVCEMLLQSHVGQVHLLPALPAAWAGGSVQGLRARGGLEVDLTWQEGKLVQATLRPQQSGRFKVRYGEKVVELQLKTGKAVTLNGELTPQ